MFGVLVMIMIRIKIMVGKFVIEIILVLGTTVVDDGSIGSLLGELVGSLLGELI